MTGTIAGFSGSMGSGLASVHFEEGGVAYVESGYGLRQFANAFGALELATGQEIEYEVDALGLMTFFQPAE